MHRQRVKFLQSVAIKRHAPMARVCEGVCGRRQLASFDVFQKLRDPLSEESSALKRKPSDKVIRLVDEIMNLTLIEAADLCDLCQQKLSERSGGPEFNSLPLPGRSPFPHPMGLFAGMPQMMPQMIPQMSSAQTMHQPPIEAPLPTQVAPLSAAMQENKVEKPKAMVTVKLVGFDQPKKVAVVKEVRAITSLGLKESKELVEDCPKVIKKAVPISEAEEMKKKLEAAGGQVTLE